MVSGVGVEEQGGGQVCSVLRNKNRRTKRGW